MSFKSKEAERAYKREWARQYRAKNRERLQERNREWMREWYRANPELARAQARKRRKADPEGYSKRRREYEAKNPDRVREWQRAARAREKAERPHLARERSRRFREANREKVRETNRRYAASNPDKVRANVERRRARRVAAAGAGWSAEDVKAQHAAQKGRCFYCKHALKRYECDHVIPLDKGGHHCRSNLVLACITCNRRKGTKDPQDFAGILL